MLYFNSYSLILLDGKFIYRDLVNGIDKGNFVYWGDDNGSVLWSCPEKVLTATGTTTTTTTTATTTTYYFFSTIFCLY
ncbi:hypothetical protein PIROE2DRAFT_7183 [Piromyces sp. E2]|nr:hypothetical protein PIROE2DRAFT_7183 [Piromyces sp. E2]|eukprot:OUM65767.1 hypothetical protein PIROE2DRAFT_7183 [Piromyces sp. E2]